VILSVDLALRKAKRHTKRGEANLAAQKYKSVLEKYPKNKRAIEGLKALQQPTAVKAAANAAPSQERINGLIALYNQGKLQEALIQGEALAKQFPDVPFTPNLLGAVNVGLGRLEEAVASYTVALQIKPDFAEAHNNLGNALNQLGKPEQAVSSLTKALRIKPDFAEAHNNLGAALNNLGKPEQAVSSLTKALQIKPDFAEAHYNHGAALTHLGKPEEAVASYSKALQIKPDYADAHYNLGNALSKLGKPEQAVSSFTKALQIKPDFAEAHNNLGAALYNLGKPEQAVSSLAKALQIKPDYAEAHYNLGNVFNDLEKAEEAVSSLAKALQIKPDYAEAHNNLGNTLNDLGKPNEAVSSFTKALQIKPDYAEAHRNLSTVKKYQDGDPQIDQMLQLVERQNLSDEDRMHLNFALGKAHGEIGNHDKAFSCLLDGNRLRKEEQKYDISSARASFTKIKSTFSEDIPALNVVKESAGAKGQQPILILGMPRSGTTLVEQILASHPQVYGAGELKLLGQSVNTIKWNSTRLSSDQLRSIRKSYLSGLTKIGASELYITDKMPLNFQWIGFIVAATPEAKIVHVKRDARATCWSNFKHYFSRKGNGFANDLQDVVEYYKMYIDLMAFWHAKFPGRLYDLNYEALTEHQEDETRKLLEYVGLNWEDQCLEFHRTERAVRTASATQVRQKMYQGSSEEWRKYQKHLQPMVELLSGF
jgi:tetratricopeptide (TPR) repeat protein